MTELVVDTGDRVVRIGAQNDQWSAASLPIGRGMQCLAVHFHNQDVLYAGSQGKCAARSKSRDDWTRLGLAEPNVFSLAVSPASDSQRASACVLALIVIP